MKFGLKWVHMARWELILRLDGALWLRIILKPLLTQQRAMKLPNIRKKVKNILELAKNRCREAGFPTLETIHIGEDVGKTCLPSGKAGA